MRIELGVRKTIAVCQERSNKMGSGCQVSIVVFVCHCLHKKHSRPVWDDITHSDDSVCPGLFHDVIEVRIRKGLSRLTHREGAGCSVRYTAT